MTENLARIIAAVAKHARDAAAYHEHMAATPGLNPGLASSHRWLAKRFLMAAVRVEQKDPETIKWVCGCLALDALFDEYELEVRRAEADTDPSP
ncbi:hypothetical protein ACFOM8_22790 [Paracoccus angustae]|uniref:Uncharacterized protein n=1 Tax=Paracoccus angustae TaxID=1671480 RepID=A0ABV7UBM8_9RHOB|nr:hypothetical protein [Paracoccus yeei]